MFGFYLHCIVSLQSNNFGDIMNRKVNSLIEIIGVYNAG